MDDKIKQVIVVRRNYYDKNGNKFGMRLGKIIAQACHASNGAAFLARSDKQQFKTLIDGQESHITTLFQTISKEEEEWYFEKFTKATLQVEEEHELLELAEQVKKTNIPYFLVLDEGVTEFNNIPTYTCLAIGPAKSSEIDKITGKLKLL